MVADGWPLLAFEALRGVQLLALGWNVAPGWRAVQGDASDALADLPEPQPLARSLLVWRVGLDTRWRAVESLACSVLGKRLEAACQTESRQPRLSYRPNQRCACRPRPVATLAKRSPRTALAVGNAAAIRLASRRRPVEPPVK